MHIVIQISTKFSPLYAFPKLIVSICPGCIVLVPIDSIKVLETASQKKSDCRYKKRFQIIENQDRTRTNDRN